MSAVDPNEDLAEVVARLQAELAEQRQEAAALRDAATRHDQFLATLAHELRNPLAPICTSLEILRIAGDQAEIRDTHRAIIDRQARRMVRLIDDLIDISQSSRGKIQLHKEKVELGSIIGKEVEEIQPMVHRYRHRLNIDLPEPHLTFEADPNRLSHILHILLDNACKFTEPEGHILIEGHRDGDDVCIRIKDSGIGIPADQLTGIFEMFSQVQKSSEQSRGGLGIGLSLVHRLVTLHGGGVSARSDGPGQGSEFTVRLPIGQRS